MLSCMHMSEREWVCRCSSPSKNHSLEIRRTSIQIYAHVITLCCAHHPCKHTHTNGHSFIQTNTHTYGLSCSHTYNTRSPQAHIHKHNHSCTHIHTAMKRQTVTVHYVGYLDRRGERIFDSTFSRGNFFKMTS